MALIIEEVNVEDSDLDNLPDLVHDNVSVGTPIQRRYCNHGLP
jgi:hypothetical protein